jgi:N-acyl-D-aspartate/D-glutamate deacylase
MASADLADYTDAETDVPLHSPVIHLLNLRNVWMDCKNAKKKVADEQNLAPEAPHAEERDHGGALGMASGAPEALRMPANARQSSRSAREASQE